MCYTSGRTPLTFVTFGRCTGRSMTACSTHAFRVCLPAEYNSLRGHASLGCVRMLLAPEALSNHLQLIRSPNIVFSVWAYGVCPYDLHRGEFGFIEL
jgi:hypothetical protein